jgi:membrane associated rhomboid family serine protease
MAYQRFDRGEYRPQFGGFSFFPPVIKYILIANVAVFFLQNMLGGLTVGGNSANAWFITNFYLMPTGEFFRPWQLVTYMFLHHDFMHIFFNMLMLWMFGMEVEHTWGSKKFFCFYIAGGIAGGLAHLFIAPLLTAPGPAIGASGAVFGVLTAFAMLFPDRYVYIYFLLPVKTKYLVPVFIAMELFYGVTGTSEGVAHMAHLGGAALGVLWVLLDSRGVIDRLLRTSATARPAATPGMRQKWTAPVRDATVIDMPPPRPEQKAADEHARYQDVIDSILDKISTSGYASLTEQEKRLLLDASKRIHPDGGSSDG